MPSYDHKFACLDNLRQSIRNKIEKSSKIGQDKKSLISTFCVFLTTIAKVIFWKRDWPLSCVLTLIWGFFIWEINTRFFIRNTFRNALSNPRLKLAKINQMLSNTLRLNFYYLKIIHIFHPRYNLGVMGHVLGNGRWGQCVCIHGIVRLAMVGVGMGIGGGVT